MLHHALHGRELFGRRVHVFRPEQIHAGSCRADVRGDVHRNALALEQLQVFAERRPFDGILEVALLRDEVLLHLGRQRPHGLALAHHLERHALAQLALAATVDQERFVRPGQHVDEAGRDGLPGRVDLAARLARRLRPDIGDAIALDRDVAAYPAWPDPS